MGVDKSADEIVRIGMNAPQLQRSQKKYFTKKSKRIPSSFVLDYE